MDLIRRWGVLELEQLEDRSLLAVGIVGPVPGNTPPGNLGAALTSGTTAGETGITNPTAPTTATSPTTSSPFGDHGVNASAFAPANGPGTPLNPATTGLAGSTFVQALGAAGVPAPVAAPTPTEPTFAPSGLSPTEVVSTNLGTTVGASVFNPIGVTSVPLNGLATTLAPLLASTGSLAPSPFIPTTSPLQDLAGPSYTGTGTVESYNSPYGYQPSPYSDASPPAVLPQSLDGLWATLDLAR